MNPQRMVFAKGLLCRDNFILEDGCDGYYPVTESQHCEGNFKVQGGIA